MSRLEPDEELLLYKAILFLRGREERQRNNRAVAGEEGFGESFE